MKKINKKDTFTHTMGDALERVGEFLTNLGATKLGNRVYKYGNKIEHKNESVVKKIVK